MGYSKAIAAISSYSLPIRNTDQFKGVPGIGSGVLKKIAEVL
jgi:DNA uptake protein ComE-like DNA-binding protein